MDILKIVIAFVLAFGLGAICRFFDIPCPAPPALLGSCIIFAITLGYIVCEKFVQ